MDVWTFRPEISGEVSRVSQQSIALYHRHHSLTVSYSNAVADRGVNGLGDSLCGMRLKTNLDRLLMTAARAQFQPLSGTLMSAWPRPVPSLHPTQPRSRFYRTWQRTNYISSSLAAIAAGKRTQSGLSFGRNPPLMLSYVYLSPRCQARLEVFRSVKGLSVTFRLWKTSQRADEALHGQ